MKFVALVSGGKDSFFNLLHCINAGHELVALANLHPRRGRPDEIDSYMFQTVGHQVVEKLSLCTNVPLFRAEISENEDIVVDEIANLLLEIKNRIPELEGVSVGAIGSQYQQLRVDRACSKAGMRALSYLWQRPQRELLHEITQSGLDVRVIKVAGSGLTERHLGQPLKDIEAELLELHASNGLHPCGEGGEYETMVFDAPFFTKRMVMKDPRPVQHSLDDVYYLDFEVTLEEKPTSNAIVPVPPLLMGIKEARVPKTDLQLSRKPQELVMVFSVGGSFETVFQKLAEFLNTNGVETVFHVVAAIRNMDNFASMNQQYIDVFTNLDQRSKSYIDPSRACIEVPTTTNSKTEIELEVYYTTKPDLAGRGIHVQGLSYWAPASIGPYSQCKMVFGISYMAGQIGLVPQTLALASDLETQARLALQNAVRVLDLMHEFRSNWVPRLAIVYLTNASDRKLAAEIWSEFSNLPLLTVVISGLPRGARFEWSLQACDIRYFKWFVPECDEDDELYSPVPEMSLAFDGYSLRAGFQVLRVAHQPIKDYKIAFTTKEKVPHSVQALSVFYNLDEVNEAYIAF